MKHEGIATGEFRKILVEAIDESLSSIGESPKQAIFFHLENTFNIKKQEIASQINAFDSALKKIFGPGADFLEDLILKKIGEKADSIFPSSLAEAESFGEKITTLKRIMEDEP